MPRTETQPRRRFDVESDDLWTPGDAVQMDALVAACALVAHADGWVTPEERGRMVDRLRHTAAVSVFGVDEVIAAFEALNRRFERDLDDGETTAEIAVVRLRGQAGPSHLLIEAACSVAEADGGFDLEEREVIVRLCKLLGLDPARYGLVPVDGDRR